MQWKRAEDFENFEKSQYSWELDTEWEGSTFGLVEARRICALDGGGEMEKPA